MSAFTEHNENIVQRQKIAAIPARHHHVYSHCQDVASCSTGKNRTSRSTLNLLVLIVVERRSVSDIERDFRFQASGRVKDQDPAKIGHSLGLDYVAVFDALYQDLKKLYRLRNQIDTWEVKIPVKIVAVNTAEVKLHSLGACPTLT